MGILHGYIGVGSNLGNRLANLQRAVEMMAATARLEVLAASAVYESPPWGYVSDNAYYNAVVSVDWNGPPLRLLEHCYRIEAALGRHSGGQREFDGYRDRTIDLDIIWLDGMESSSDRLVLPHPNAHLRAFVLKPLIELAPALVLQDQVITGLLAGMSAEESGSVTLVEGAVLIPQ